MSVEQNIYFFGTIDTVSHAYHIFQNHTLVFLYGGRLHLRNQCGETLSIESGDSAFIGRDSYSHLYAEPEGNNPCRVLFFSIPREFLCEYYQTLPASTRELPVAELSALHRLEQTPDTESLFRSWIPYIQEELELSDEVLRLKMTEAVQALLNTTKKYIPVLFDFAGGCRMNVFDLLRKPAEREIKWQELKLSLTAN